MTPDDSLEFSRELDKASTRFGLKVLGRKEFSGFRLPEADLRGISLWGSYWGGADLRGADLSGSSLERACLRGVNLSKANLTWANLRQADLGGANLSGANLGGADMTGARLHGADLTDAQLPEFQLCPPKGESFRAWKRVRGNVVLELEIPADAERTSSLVSRKCRASLVRVIRAAGSGVSETHRDEFESLHDKNFKYRVGCVAAPRIRPYDGDIRTACASGIHFFMTHQEAETYSY